MPPLLAVGVDGAFWLIICILALVAFRTSGLRPWDGRAFNVTIPAASDNSTAVGAPDPSTLYPKKRNLVPDWLLIFSCFFIAGVVLLLVTLAGVVVGGLEFLYLDVTSRFDSDRLWCAPDGCVGAPKQTFKGNQSTVLLDRPESQQPQQHTLVHYSSLEFD